MKVYEIDRRILRYMIDMALESRKWGGETALAVFRSRKGLEISRHWGREHYVQVPSENIVLLFHTHPIDPPIPSVDDLDNMRAGATYGIGSFLRNKIILAFYEMLTDPWDVISSIKYELALDDEDFGQCLLMLRRVAEITGAEYVIDEDKLMFISFDTLLRIVEEWPRR